MSFQVTFFNGTTTILLEDIQSAFDAACSAAYSSHSNDYPLVIQESHNKIWEAPEEQSQLKLWQSLKAFAEKTDPTLILLPSAKRLAGICGSI